MWRTRLDPRIEELLGRLAAQGLDRPVLDVAAAEAALARRLRMLGLRPRPVRWAADARSAFLEVYRTAWSAARGHGDGAYAGARSAVACNSARGRDIWRHLRTGETVVILSEGLEVGDRIRATTRSPLWSSLQDRFERRALETARRRLRALARTAPDLAGCTGSLDYAARKALELAIDPSAIDVAGGLTHHLSEDCLKQRPAFARIAREWLPLVELWEAGVWMTFVLAEGIICVPRPAVQVNRQGRLHCDGAEALRWLHAPQARGLFYLNGIRVTRQIATDPNLDPAILLRIRNVDMRREIVRRLGIRVILEKLHARVVDKQGDYELLNLDLGDGRSRPYLKMANPSLSRPGKPVWHIEGVGPEIAALTVRAALAWRNGRSDRPKVLT